MLRPLEQWYCDNCGEIIESVDDGYVIWRHGTDGKDKDFKIIHQGRCDNRNFPSSMALSDFLGTDGLAMLLTFLSIGPVMVNNGNIDRSRVSDFTEFVDFVRRVQTPFYEEARRSFGESRLLEHFSDANEIFPYIDATLRNIVRDYK